MPSQENMDIGKLQLINTISIIINTPMLKKSLYLKLINNYSGVMV